MPPKTIIAASLHLKEVINLSEVVSNKNSISRRATAPKQRRYILVENDIVDATPLYPTTEVMPLPEDCVNPDCPSEDPNVSFPDDLDPDFGVDPLPEEDMPLSSMPLAMAYVPMQQWKRLYSEDVALNRGTLFEQLDLPFLGEEVIPNG